MEDTIIRFLRISLAFLSLCVHGQIGSVDGFVRSAGYPGYYEAGPPLQDVVKPQNSSWYGQGDASGSIEPLRSKNIPYSVAVRGVYSSESYSPQTVSFGSGPVTSVHMFGSDSSARNQLQGSLISLASSGRLVSSSVATALGTSVNRESVAQLSSQTPMQTSRESVVSSSQQPMQTSSQSSAQQPFIKSQKGRLAQVGSERFSGTRPVQTSSSGFIFKPVQRQNPSSLPDYQLVQGSHGSHYESRVQSSSVQPAQAGYQPMAQPSIQQSYQASSQRSEQAISQFVDQSSGQQSTQASYQTRYQFVPRPGGQKPGQTQYQPVSQPSGLQSAQTSYQTRYQFVPRPGGQKPGQTQYQPVSQPSGQQSAQTSYQSAQTRYQFVPRPGGQKPGPIQYQPISQPSGLQTVQASYQSMQPPSGQKPGLTRYQPVSQPSGQQSAQIRYQSVPQPSGLQSAQANYQSMQPPSGQKPGLTRYQPVSQPSGLQSSQTSYQSAQAHYQSVSQPSGQSVSLQPGFQLFSMPEQSSYASLSSFGSQPLEQPSNVQLASSYESVLQPDLQDTAPLRSQTTQNERLSPGMLRLLQQVKS